MKKVLTACIFLFLAQSAAAQSVGMAPSKYQIDNIEQGETMDFTVYLTSSGTIQNFTVKPVIKPSQKEEIFDDEGFVNAEEYSEQDVRSWVEWDKEEFKVTPGSSETYTLSNGATIVANGRMDGKLQVPSNAEPGYHAFQIGVNPQFSQGSGFGASVFGLARSQFRFRVPGEAEREIEVQDISARRTGEKEFQFVLNLANTGSVTVTVTDVEFTLRNSQGEKIGRLDGSGAEISSGAIKDVEILWVKEGLEGGNYRLHGSADYRTGEAFFDETVTMTQTPRDPVQVDNPDQQNRQQDGQQASAPLLLILVATLGIGSVLYAFGFDLLWAFAVSGAAGIAIFIITAGLPLYVLLLGLIGATVLYMYR